MATTIVSSGTRTVSSGLLIEYAFVSSGAAKVYGSGALYKTIIMSGGKAFVSFGGLISSTSVRSDGSMFVYSGGTASKVDISQNAFVSAAGGSVCSATLAGSSATLNVFGVTSGGYVFSAYASGVWLQAGGQMIIGYYAQVDYVEVDSGYVFVSSGGLLQHTNIGGGPEKSGQVYLKPWGVGISNTVSSNGIMVVSSAGTATSTLVQSGGSLVAYAGGILNKTSAGGKVILSGGTASSSLVSSGGSVAAFSGGLITGGSAQAGGSFSVLTGGSAENARVDSGAILVASTGGKCAKTTVASGRILVFSGGTATETTMQAGTATIYGESDSGTYNGGKVIVTGGSSIKEKLLGGEMHVSASGTEDYGYVSGLTIQSATAYFNSFTYLNAATVSSGGKLYAYEGARVSSVDVKNGGEAFIKSGGYVSGGSIWGSEVIMSGGSAHDLFVLLNGTLDVRGKVSGCTVSSGGKAIVSSGGLFTASNFGSGARMSAMSGGSAVIFNTSSGSAVASGGSVYVSGGVLDYAAVYGGIINISSGARVLDAFVSAGTLAIQNGGNAASALVVAGSDVTSLTVNPGASMSYLNASGASARINVGSGGSVYNANILLGAVATFKGDVTSALVFSGASASVSSGGFLSNVTVAKDAFLKLYSSGKASNVIVSSGGDLVVNSGGTAVETTVGSSGVMTISSGGSVVSGVTVASGGWLRIASSGYADAIILNTSGEMQIEGGTVMNLLVRKDCRAIVSGGSIVSATLANGGSALCYNGRLAGTVSSGGTAIFSGGMTTGLTVISGGKVRLADNLSMLAGDSIAFNTGGILDFDISGITASGYAALLEGYNDHILHGGDAVYTLTVGDSQKDMTYRLASNASLFNSTITVQNGSGESLGTLMLGGATKIGDKNYSLNLDGESVLSVSVSSAAPEPVTVPPFLTGDFNGDKADMLARQKDGVVTIFMNGEPWGLGVTLDPGWDALATGDFDGDKMDDILRVNTEGYVVGEMSNGNGTFTPQVLNLKNAGWSILGTGDFNHNGTDDVLIANPTGASETVGLLGYWESGVTWTLINGYSAEWEMVSTGDFNGDGKCDMLWRNSFEGEGGLTYNAYCTWIVDNPVDWRMVSVANPSEWNFVCSGDFDGDGMNDIAMINGEGVVGIWGVNDGYLSSWSILSAVDTSAWELAGVGDYNGDGSDDIAWRQTSTGLTGYWQINNKELTGWQNIATIA